MATEVLSNEDLLREILLRLPVKPLLRFKCVSKHWLALISEPRFCHLHTLHQYHASRPFPSALLVGNTDTNATSFRCPIIPLKSSDSDSNKASKVSNLISKPKSGPRRIGFGRIATIIADTWAAFSRNIPKATQPRPRRRPQFKTLCIDSDLFTNFRYVKVPGMSITIMQSCNGLLLLEGEPLEKPPNKINPRCFVYNPTTNQFVAVNFPNPQFGYLVIVSHFLSFEPLRSPHYKVILISIRIRDLSKYSLRDYVVNVYSSETGSWSDPGVCFTVPENSKAVYCNGALYWYSKNIVNSMYFDVQDNCFKTFPTPLGINNKSVTYFGESGGHLHLIAHSWMEFEFDILELNEDRSGWSVRFHVNLHPMIDYCSDLGKFDLLSVAEMIHCDICCVVRQENEVGSMLVFSKYGKFIAYNLVDSTFRELGSFSSFFRSWRYDVFQYYENLSWVSPSNGY